MGSTDIDHTSRGADQVEHDHMVFFQQSARALCPQIIGPHQVPVDFNVQLGHGGGTTVIFRQLN